MPRITFGMIVLNGEPFLRYNLRTLYPFAHQIILVEGAALAAANIATPDGHSLDNTLEIARQFKASEDPDGKLTIVTAEDEGYPNGFWPGEKHQQSQAYARRATGDYLWQVDVDEFYQPNDILFVLRMLTARPDITAVSFKMITFWGGFDYITDGWYLRQGAKIYRRLFKWGPDYCYVTHRPPTVYNAQQQDLFTKNPVNGYQMARYGVFLYHYSLVFPHQVRYKSDYYSRANWASHIRQARSWAESSFLKLDHPFRVHNVYQYPSWLERYRRQHPPEIEALRQDIVDKKIVVNMRATDDIERLLNTPIYRLGRFSLKVTGDVWWFGQRIFRKIKTILSLIIQQSGQ